MTLIDMGWNETIGDVERKSKTEGFELGRILSEQKERYSVFAESGEYDAEITGSLRYTARSREDFPAVGDWVRLSPVDGGFAIIHTVLPRYSSIKRSSPDKRGEIQIIAANIDYALIVQAADRDFNLNRIERYLAICGDSRIKPVVAITKIDLFGEERLADLEEQLRSRLPDTPYFMISNETGAGLKPLRERIRAGETWCLLGSSGVGKSTLLNSLFGKAVMETGAISGVTAKGKHTTSHRELVVLDGGGILIDNPGMREVGMTDDDAGLDRTFSGIAELSLSCRFSDCTHVHEKGCAVLEALESGALDPDLYKNYLKMEREKYFFAATIAEKRKKAKDFGKMAKNYQKEKNKNKF